jgi:hypothetical protein
LAFNGGNSGWIRTQDDEKIGDVPVDQKLELMLRQNEGAQTFTNGTAEWGPLWLIHQYKGQRDKLDPQTWLVEMPVWVPNAVGSVRLKLKFEGVLPELDKWPAH